MNYVAGELLTNNLGALWCDHCRKSPKLLRKVTIREMDATERIKTRIIYLCKESFLTNFPNKRFEE